METSPGEVLLERFFQSIRSDVETSPDEVLLVYSDQESEPAIKFSESSKSKQDSLAFEFVEDPPQELICQICYNVLQEPHVTDCCGQHFCKCCLDSSVNEYTRIKACPHCRERNYKHLIYKPYQRQINELIVYCKNRSRGCLDTMKLGVLEQHVSVENSSGCQYTLLPCPNDCYEDVLRRDMDEHRESICGRRKVTCEHCDEEMIYCLLESHYEECDKYPVLCPRNCSSGMFIREELAEHENVCPNMSIQCPFYDAGCTEEVIRAELTDHLESNTADHLGKVMTSYCDLKSEFQALKNKYDGLQKEVCEIKQNYTQKTAIKECGPRSYPALTTSYRRGKLKDTGY